MGIAVTAAVARVVAVAETAEAEKEGALVAFPQAAQAEKPAAAPKAVPAAASATAAEPRAVEAVEAGS